MVYNIWYVQRRTIIMNLHIDSCEIEDVAETLFCKLCDVCETSIARTIMGDHSELDQKVLVKIGKYIPGRFSWVP